MSSQLQKKLDAIILDVQSIAVRLEDLQHAEQAARVETTAKVPKPKKKTSIKKPKASRDQNLMRC
jgi:hypothetical protein